MDGAEEIKKCGYRKYGIRIFLFPLFRIEISPLWNFVPHAFSFPGIYWSTRGGAADMWCGRGGGGGCWLGVCAVSLGLGILIAAIFPTGFLLFIVALLLIACGSACLRR